MKKNLQYLNNLCYNLIINKLDRRETNTMKKEEKGIFDARTLACYIGDKYKGFSHGKEISNIKLQKSLYFLLAFWGGFIRKGTLKDTETDVSTISDILFSNEIQAWVYGPVVVDVYHARKNNCLNEYREDLGATFEIIPMLKDTIDSLLEDIFAVADFKLVSTSHEDMSWQNHFDITAERHNEKIPQEEIIQEYTLRDAI